MYKVCNDYSYLLINNVANNQKPEVRRGKTGKTKQHEVAPRQEDVPRFGKILHDRPTQRETHTLRLFSFGLGL